MELTNHTKKNGNSMHLKEKYEEFAQELQDALSENKKVFSHAAKDMQKSVKKNPWAYIGAAAGVALLTGFILGKKK